MVSCCVAWRPDDGCAQSPGARLSVVRAAGPACGLPFLPELFRVCRARARAPRRVAWRSPHRAPPLSLRSVAPRRLRPGTLSMDTQRLILLFIFGFSVLMLWEAWQREHQPKPPAHAEQPAAPKAPSAAPAPSQGAIGAPATAAQKGESIVITTDLVIAEIDTLGGTLKRLELLRHKDSNDPDKNFVLISPAHQYEAQSGLTGEGGANHRR